MSELRPASHYAHIYSPLGKVLWTHGLVSHAVDWFVHGFSPTARTTLRMTLAEYVDNATVEYSREAQTQLIFRSIRSVRLVGRLNT